MADGQLGMLISEDKSPRIEGGLNLSMQSVLSHFLKSSASGQLLNFMMALDRFDRWAVDHNEMQNPLSMRVQEYIQDLSSLIEENIAVLHRVPLELAGVLSHVTTSRCIYLLTYISQHNPEFMERFAYLFEGDGERVGDCDVVTIRKRFEAFAKAKLLGDIFSGHRLQRIARIMGSYTE